MFKLVVLAVLVSIALAGYGVPANPPAPAYPVLPVHPPAFYPYPRRHRHRHSHSHSSSDSNNDSDSHSDETRCKSCRKLKTSCRDVTNVEQCREPDISIVRKSGCEHSIISCPLDAEYSLIYNKNASNVILTGKANDVLAKCNKGKNWKIGGSTFNHVACIVPQQQKQGNATCKTKYGAVAAPFRGENDRAAIKEAIKKILPNPDPNLPYMGFYIGIRNFMPTLDSEYDFRNERDLTPITYTSWMPTDPNKRLDETGIFESCVAVIVNENLNWYDYHCYAGEHRIGIICGKPPK